MLPTVRRRSGRHSPPLFISAVASSERNNHEHIAQHESTTCGKRLSQFTQESDLPQPPPSIPIHMRCGADLPAGCGFQDRPRRGAVRSDGWRLRNNRGAVAVFRRSIHPITVARTSLVGWGWACPVTY
jgi:hypothetical protein